MEMKVFLSKQISWNVSQMIRVHGYERRKTMGIKFVDLDNEKQAKDYRNEKKKARFEKEIQNVVPVVKPDPVKPIMKGKVKDIDQLRVRVEPE
jgi:hypothetical protein